MRLKLSTCIMAALAVMVIHGCACHNSSDGQFETAVRPWEKYDFNVTVTARNNVYDGQLHDNPLLE